MNINVMLIFFMLLCSILPVISIGSYVVPILYVLIPFEALLLFTILLKRLELPSIIKKVLIFFFLMSFQIFVTTTIGTIARFGSFEFPTDIIQYVARLLVFFFLFWIFYKRKIGGSVFVSYFLCFGIIGMLIGVLQWVPWFGREFLVKMYPFQDGEFQLSVLSRSLSGIRVHGIAQHATANGGLGAFFFVFGATVLRYYKKHQLSASILILLSITNVIASQARAGMLALAVAFVLLYIIDIYINKTGVKSSLKFTAAAFVIIFTLTFMYNDQNSIIYTVLNRWDELFESSGGGRVDQMEYFFSLFRSPLELILGLSKPVVNQSLIPYGVEIEPVNIFILYGIVGFILQYGLVFLLLRYFRKNMPLFKDGTLMKTLLISSYISLFAYQIFSIGYYFYREFHVGLFPWILMGVTIGVVEREKNKNKSQVGDSSENIN